VVRSPGTRVVNFVAFVAFCHLAGEAHSYTTPAHAAMTQAAADASILQSNLQVLSTLTCTNSGSPCSPNIVWGGASQGAPGILGQAAIDEDDDIRSVAHFFDDQHAGAPLSLNLSLSSVAQQNACAFYEDLNISLFSVIGPLLFPCNLNGNVPIKVGPANSQDWILYGSKQSSALFQTPLVIVNPGLLGSLPSFSIVNVPPVGCGGVPGDYECSY